MILKCIIQYMDKGTHSLDYILCHNQYTNIIPRIEWMISLTNIIQTHFIGGWDSHFLGVGSPYQIAWGIFFQAPSAQGNTVHVTPCIASTKTPACHSGKLQVMLVDSRPGCFLGQFFNSDFTVKKKVAKTRMKEVLHNKHECNIFQTRKDRKIERSERNQK